MLETKIVTEVAGRICALAVEPGRKVNEGDDVVLIEAMKMEIPVPAPTTGTLKSMLVEIDDVVAEGQIIATIEA
jgi:biotin carboxyl carrier protein